MGLCKCPRKKVTNQFCFEHKVNVCEYCMIDGPHKTCFVGPYLTWLDNSHFDRDCYLCKAELNSSDCIRLGCYHVLHSECLNQYASQFPSNTAPAGYTCPVCSSPIFSMNIKSPVYSQLEKTLSNFSWAKDGIGMGAGMNESSPTTSTNSNTQNGFTSIQSGSLLDDSTTINMPSSTTSSELSRSHVPKILPNSLMNSNNVKSNYSTPINVSNVTSFISTNSDLSFGSTSSMRSKFDNEFRRPLLTSNLEEIAEDKYRTKSPIEFLSRWLRSRSSYMKNHSTMSSLSMYKKFIIFGFLAFLFLFITIHYFVEYGRQAADNDPFLDPNFDPNLRNDND